MSQGYPFSAIVEQELLKKALLLAAIDPTIGGVLIRGDKGTAKSTAARGLVDLLPDIAARPGCPFNCEPGRPVDVCDVCHSSNLDCQPVPVPFVNLPLGATEDRVLGTLDFEKALKEGRQKFQPGLLASAHRGILYIDEVNLLADHLVDNLLDVAAMGVNTVQREGLSVKHPARVTLIGTMNPEEGDLRPQLLDRFGMMVDVSAPQDATVRASVVRSRLSYEANPSSFVEKCAEAQARLRLIVRDAMAILPEVIIDDELITLITDICCQFKIVSLRADIVMTKVARALAALSLRARPNLEDVKLASLLVLAHRKRINPMDKTGLDQNLLDQTLQQSSLSNQSKSADVPTPPPPSAASPPPRDNENSGNNGFENSDVDSTDTGSNAQPEGSEVVFAAANGLEVKTGIKLEARSSQIAGLRSRVIGGTRGRYVRAVRDVKPASLAVDATIRHAALHSGGKVGSENLHTKVRLEQNATLVVLVVDASGSMAALRRMEAVKGTTIALLEDAYRKRDHVCVIGFRGEQAELLLPPTRSAQLASQTLQELPTGGRTPLAHGLDLAKKVALESGRKVGLEPLIVVLTDGRGNVSLPKHDSPQSSTASIAATIAQLNLPTVIIDTEDGYLKLGLARTLAAAIGAEYLALDKLTSETLTLTIRGCMQRVPKR